MVARINTSKNISRALNYDEQKVQQQATDVKLPDILSAANHI